MTPAAVVPTSPFEWVERAGKTVGVVAIACYAVGLVVTNIYLFRLGVSEFDLLKPRFVLTGLIALLVPIGAVAGIAGGWALAHAAMQMTHRAWLGKGVTPRRRGRAGAWAFALLISGVIGVVVPVLAMTVAIAWNSSDTQPLRSATLVYASAMFVGLVVAGSVWVIRQPRADATAQDAQLPKLLRTSPSAWTQTFGVLLLFGLSTLLYLNTFTRRLYSSIPEQFGGGLGRLTQLVVTGDGQQGATLAGLLTDPETRLTPLLTMLFEGSDFYLVSVCGELLSVDRDLIDVVLLDTPSDELLREPGC